MGGVEYYLYYCTVVLYGINSWFALLVLILYQVLLFVRGRAAETCVLLSTLLERPICRPCQWYMNFFEQQCNADLRENVVRGLAVLTTSSRGSALHCASKKSMRDLKGRQIGRPSKVDRRPQVSAARPLTKSKTWYSININKANQLLYSITVQ